MCLDEGTLQAYLDREIDSRRIGEIEKHLAECSRCRDALALLQRSQAVIGDVLSSYRTQAEQQDYSTRGAWERFRERVTHNPAASSDQGGILRMLNRYRGLAACVAAAVLLTCLLSYGPTRTMAASLLTIFRADRLEVTELNPDDFAQFEEALRQAGVASIKDFGTIEVSSKKEFAKVTASEAAAQAGFAVRLPASLGDELKMGDITLHAASKISVTPDVKKINAILAAMGNSKMLPDSLSGQTFTVSVPAIINVRYTGTSGDVSLTQAPSPEMVVPPGVDVEEVRAALLGIPSLPAQFRQQLSLKDWQRTVLIPNAGGETQQVTVNGTSGVFTTSSEKQWSALIWQQDGIWYGLEGNFSLQQARDFAAGLNAR